MLRIAYKYEEYTIKENNKTHHIKGNICDIEKNFKTIDNFLEFSKKVIFKKPITITSEFFDVEKYIDNLETISYIKNINDYISKEIIFDDYISDNNINNIIKNIKKYKKRYSKEYHKISLEAFILNYMGFNFDNDDIKKLFVQ